MQLTLEQLVVPPGTQVLLKNIDWQTFEELLEASSETRKTPRFSYSHGWLELMSPLAIHEFDKNIISDLVKILLEELDREFIALGSVTLKSEKAKKAVEPDECFYIQHESVIRGKERIDLNVDPPPDLAIEIDITHRTHFDNYEKLGIPELWRFNGKELEILVLENNGYQASEKSRQFPHFAIKQIIPQYLEKCKQEGRNKTMKAFRLLLVSIA
ncbi:MAG: Uma2 family endonuclease [Methylovulum sp.]|nr:Uma2 family endonuclease [Methylovulum sp.]